MTLLQASLLALSNPRPLLEALALPPVQESSQKRYGFDQQAHDPRENPPDHAASQDHQALHVFPEGLLRPHPAQTQQFQDAALDGHQLGAALPARSHTAVEFAVAAAADCQLPEFDHFPPAAALAAPTSAFDTEQPHSDQGFKLAAELWKLVSALHAPAARKRLH